MDHKPDESAPQKKPVSEVFQQVWGQALVAVTSAEEEVSKLFGKLQETAGWSSEQVRQFTDRLTSQRQEVERRVEEAVGQSLNRLRVPRREEIDQITARLDKLAERVENLSK